MSLSTLYMLQAKASATKTGGHMPVKMAKDMLYTLIVLMVLDLVFLFYAIHCLVVCSQANSWSPVITVLLFVLLFVPGLGFATALGIIVYHLAVGCEKKSLAFSFY